MVSLEARPPWPPNPMNSHLPAWTHGSNNAWLGPPDRTRIRSPEKYVLSQVVPGAVCLRKIHKRNYLSQLIRCCFKHPTNHTIIKYSFRGVRFFSYGVAFFISCFGLGAAFRNRTSPRNGSPEAENPPILIRMSRGIRFWPPLGPGRPKNCQKRPDNFPNQLKSFWYGTVFSS